MPITIAQITDTHLIPDAQSHVFGFPTTASLAAVLAQVKPLAPDYLLLTGDLADAGDVLAYQKLRELVAPLKIPSLYIGGNHDLVGRMEEMLDCEPFDARKSLDLGEWRLILLNSVISTRCCAEGELSPETLTWLQTELKTYPNQPTLIALHHPPVSTGIDWLDPLGLQSPENLHEAIAPFPQVRLVVFGHIHHALHRRLNQVDFLGCPSTCVQFIPPFEIDSPSALNIDPALENNSATSNKNSGENNDLKLPGFRWLTLFEDGSYETKIHRVQFSPNELK